MRTSAHALIPARIKERPEDFVVTEITSLVPQGAGSYRLYRLTKRSWRTDDLIAHIAGRTRLPWRSISYGGKKDRRAVTAQHVTIRSRHDHSLFEETFELRSIGFTDEAMSPRHILGNRFEITLRGVPEADLGALAHNAQAVSTLGVPNYFDDQRFASCGRHSGFAAERMLRGEWEQALSLLLATPVPGDTTASRRRKRAFQEGWRDWPRCLQASRTVAERAAFRFLLEHGADYRGAVNRLPEAERAMALAAYQSHLWNRTLAAVVEGAASRVRVVPGRIAPYVFHLEIPAEARDWLSRLQIETPGPRAHQTDPVAAAAFERVLAEAALDPASVDVPGLRGARLSSYPRSALVIPEGLEIASAADDELHAGARKVALSFTLPRGAYGTMVVKRLLVAEPSPERAPNRRRTRFV